MTDTTKERTKGQNASLKATDFTRLPKRKLYHLLFWSNFYISAFTFGGGYVMLPLLKKRYVQELGWLEEEEILNFLAIAQSCPGPMAINISVQIGLKVGGILGIFIASLATMLPPMFILTLLFYLYNSLRELRFISYMLEGMQIAISAEILYIVYGLIYPYLRKKDVFFLGVYTLALIALYLLHFPLLLVLLLASLFGICFPTLRKFFSSSLPWPTKECKTKKGEFSSLDTVPVKQDKEEKV